MDSGKSEAEIAAAVSKYDKIFDELESLSKDERKTIKDLESTETFEDVLDDFSKLYAERRKGLGVKNETE